MSVGSFLYQLFLSPIILLLEAVFAPAYHILKSCGAAIFPLSFVVNILLLPFYNRAEAISEEERKRNEQMAPFVEHIKKTFKGDERYMMLQSFYKENSYKPVYALRSSIALILEVPFFIAAYNFLSDLTLLRGTPFLFLKDLGKPDELFIIGGLTVNVLPILMTLINVISSEIYTRGQKFKDKITLHGMALIFLILLYNSPSGLVLYWTLNNVFSLVKNIVYKSSDRKKAAKTALAVTSLLVIVYALFFKGAMLGKLYILLAGVLLLFPMLIHPEKKDSSREVPTDNKLFLMGALFLSIFLGALIPSSVIMASPSEFVILSAIHSPVRYILFAFLTAFGAFVIWGGLFYYLAGNKSRRRATAAIWCFAFISAVNFLLFGKSQSILNADLKFDGGLFMTPTSVLLNFLVVCAVIGLIIFLMMRGTRVIRFLAPILLIVAGIMSGYNIHKINTEMPGIRRAAEYATKDVPEVQLSRDGKNVVVIMVDKGISPFIPYIFQEKPELKDQFSGFVWYPNTLSFGYRTVIAAPALFGGYDYTPDKINDRTSELLVDKHNEALLTMPVLFSEAGYEVTVFDPPYAGYSHYPDLSIYDPYPEIKAYNTELGLFRHTDNDAAVMKNWKRNFFCYSLMKASPLILQPVLYSNGSYFSPDPDGSLSGTVIHNGVQYTISPAEMSAFCNSYYALEALSSITDVDESGKDHFFVIQNSTAHDAIPLQEPEYVPSYEVDNTEFEKTHADRFTYNGHSLEMSALDQKAHYQSNMAAWIQLGHWMDHLKEIGVYDNTRIIIVSDHGWPLESDPNMLFLDGAQNNARYNSKDGMAYNPVLFVKDFGASGEYTVDDSFMTNADTPYLATYGLIEDPVNPFTLNPIYRPDIKYSDKLYVFYTDTWSMEKNYTTFTSGGTNIWYSLRNQNIFDKSNWEEEDQEP